MNEKLKEKLKQLLRDELGLDDDAIEVLIEKLESEEDEEVINLLREYTDLSDEVEELLREKIKEVENDVRGITEEYDKMEFAFSLSQILKTVQQEMEKLREEEEERKEKEEKEEKEKEEKEEEIRRNMLRNI